MSLLDGKIKELIDQLYYTNGNRIVTDRASIEFIIKEAIDWTLSLVIPPGETEISHTIKELKK